MCNRNLDKIKKLHTWFRKNGKKIFMLANSGGMNYCSAHNFHDFVTMPKEESDTEEIQKKKADYANLLGDLTEVFSNSFVIDLYQYAPVYDRKFKENFYLNGHMNAAGYLLTAKMIESYVDWIVRNHAKEFSTNGLIGMGINPYK